MNTKNRVLPSFSQPAQVVNGADRFGKRIIKTFIKHGREYQYHATKGWRYYKAVN
jgi:hypothetical protein